MGEPLSPNRVFDFPMDEPEPHPAYDFFAPRPLPGHAVNPNNKNRWIEADVLLLGELGAKADEPMVGLVVNEIVEPIVEMEEQVITPVIDMEEDIAMLFGDGDFRGPSTAAAEGQSFTLPAPGFPVPSSVSNAKVADGIIIGEIGPRVSAIEGHVQVMASQMVQVAGRLEQVSTQVEQGQQTQLQTMVSEMSSHKSTLMQCILGMDRRLADLERRPPGPQ
ncbi:hypothetical protein Tco_0299651 [Tanacetum coccineum]